jgi:hypothetical protein
MLLIVESQTSHGLYIVQSKRCEQNADIFNLICNIIFSEDLTSNDFGLLRFANIRHTMGKNCISIVGSSILGKEPHKSLKEILVKCRDMSWT